MDGFTGWKRLWFVGIVKRRQQDRPPPKSTLPAEEEREKKIERLRYGSLYLYTDSDFAAAATIDSRSVKCWNDGNSDPTRHGCSRTSAAVAVAAFWWM